MRCEVLVLKVALVMLKDHGNHIFSENLDKSLYFGVGFITVIFQLKKSWLLHKNLIPSFLESKYGILGPIFQSGNIFGKPVYNDFLTKAHCVIYHLTQKFLRNRFIYKKNFEFNTNFLYGHSVPMRCEVLVLKVALVMLKDHGNHIFSENLDKSLYFGVGFITVIFQLKKSWLLHKNLIPSFLESK